MRQTRPLFVSVAMTLLGACIESQSGEPRSEPGDSAAISETGETAPDAAEGVPDIAPDAATAEAPDTHGEPDSDEPDTHDAVAGEVAIVAAEGEEVPPQTILHLDVVGLEADSACIEWSVVQPIGSVSVFSPSSFVRSPTFEVNVVGRYELSVVISDCHGRLIARRQHIVMAVSDEALHIELLWRTPGDPNESDTGGDPVYMSVGSDVDLHLLDLRGSGTYFDLEDDCYWENTIPTWHEAPEYQPRLDRDDTDGAGPENINLHAFEPDARFQVGVHYWNDWGYGSTFATVRVYVHGELAGEWGDVELINDDMWDVLTIDAQGAVTRIGDTPKIKHDYRTSP